MLTFFLPQAIKNRLASANLFFSLLFEANFDKGISPLGRERHDDD